MTKPFSTPWGFNEKILTKTESQRIEGHDAHFIRVVDITKHGDVPTDAYNYRTFPVTDFLAIPEVASYKVEMDELTKSLV